MEVLHEDELLQHGEPRAPLTLLASLVSVVYSCCLLSADAFNDREELSQTTSTQKKAFCARGHLCPRGSSKCSMTAEVNNEVFAHSIALRYC